MRAEVVIGNFWFRFRCALSFGFGVLYLMVSVLVCFRYLSVSVSARSQNFGSLGFVQIKVSVDHCSADSRTAQSPGLVYSEFVAFEIEECRRIKSIDSGPQGGGADFDD
jgi:hypothetical protein